MVTPLPKDGDLSKCTNYRPISLLPLNYFYYQQPYVDTGLQQGIYHRVSLANFKDGYSLFASDLTPDRTPEHSCINLLCKNARISENLSMAFENPKKSSPEMKRKKG